MEARSRQVLLETTDPVDDENRELNVEKDPTQHLHCINQVEMVN